MRLAIALAVVLAGLAAFGAPAASADQTIQVTASPSPTIDGATTTITVTGSSDTGGSVYAALDTAGGTCATNPSNDNGTMVISGDSVGAPSYSDSQTATPGEGSYLLCTWLMPAGDDGSGTPLAGPASAPLTVQALQATVTLSAPVRVAYQQTIPVTINWQANSAGSLFVNVLPTSYGPCTADPANEPQYVGWLSGQGGYTNNDPVGDNSASGTTRYFAGEFAPDTYQVCAWVEEPSGGVVAGPVAVDVRMLALPGSRTYSGRTSQHLPVKVTITGYTVEDIVYSVHFGCTAPEYFATGQRWNGIWSDTVLTAANFGTLKLVDGRFKANLDANPANRINFRGRLTGTTLSGLLHAMMRVGPPQFRRRATCRTGNVSFSITTPGTPTRATPSHAGRHTRPVRSRRWRHRS